MFQKIKKSLITVLCITLLLSLTSCSFVRDFLNPDETTTEAPESTDAPKDESTDAGSVEITLDPSEPVTFPIPPEDYKFKNPLTGLPTELDLQNQRAIAFAVDNSFLSFPQSGISNADVLCEFVGADETTSFIAICKNPANGSLMGPLGVASSAHVSIAAAFDAILFSKNATESVKNGIETLSSPLFAYEINKPSFGFYESEDRKNEFGYAYSIMGEGVRLLAAVTASGTKTTSANSFSEIFKFYEGEEEYKLGGGTSANIYIPATSSQRIQLVYSASMGKYYRYAFGTNQQIDKIDGDAVAFENVFILSASDSNTAGEGEPAVSVGTRGGGYYAYGGRYVRITWTKSANGGFRFYNENGSELTIPAGKSYMGFFTEAQIAGININYSR